MCSRKLAKVLQSVHSIWDLSLPIVSLCAHLYCLQGGCPILFSGEGLAEGRPSLPSRHLENNSVAFPLQPAWRECCSPGLPCVSVYLPGYLCVSSPMPFENGVEEGTNRVYVCLFALFLFFSE